MVTDRLAALGLWLEKLFRCREVDRDPRLKIICASLLSYYYLTFSNFWHWAPTLSTQANETLDYVPAAIFENLRWLIFMDVESTRLYLYALGMLALLGMFSLFYLRSSRLAMGLMAFLFVNKVYFYLADGRLFANFHHFHLLFTLVFLVARDKLRFFRCALAVGYLMSGVVKISPSWLYGEYFNSLPGKLPFLPKVGWVVTAASIGVIVMELAGPLIWFTSVRWLRRLTFLLFLLFHLYSGVLVAFWYTTLMLPLVVAAFIRFDRPLQSGFRYSPRHLPALAILGAVILSGFYHYTIPGDVRLTGEGRYFGFFMFDANRQVECEIVIQKGGKVWKIRVNRAFQNSATETADDVNTEITCEVWQNGMGRGKSGVGRPIVDEGQVIFNPAYFVKLDTRKFGDPYFLFYYARELERRFHPDNLALRMDVQLNQHPEVFRLVDIPDFTQLNPTYNPYRHNSWINLPDTNSPAEYRWP